MISMWNNFSVPTKPGLYQASVRPKKIGFILDIFFVVSLQIFFSEFCGPSDFRSKKYQNFTPLRYIVNYTLKIKLPLNGNGVFGARKNWSTCYIIITQHLLESSIIASGLWLIQENLKDTVFVLGKFL